MQLHGDPALRAQMGERGRQHAVAHHSTRAAVASYDRLLRQVAQGRAGTKPR